ncbi:MAG: peptidase C14 [Blastocatellia bacterium]
MDLSIRELNELKYKIDAAEGRTVPAARAVPPRGYILAEGDSWFAYPRRQLIFGAAGNVVSCLREAHKDLEFDDISSNGDEAVAMVAGEQKLDFLTRIARSHYSLILFSGGGNDLVGQYDFDFFLRRRSEVADPLDCLIEERVARRLDRVMSSYADLIDLVSEYSKNRTVKIIGHTYDWAIPSPEGAAFWGGLIKVDRGRSWMNPYLTAKGVTDLDEQYAIVKQLLSRFAAGVKDLAARSNGRFVVVDTQGTLPERDRKWWVNEIHPSPEGFARIADRIYQEGMKPLLP